MNAKSHNNTTSLEALQAFPQGALALLKALFGLDFSGFIEIRAIANSAPAIQKFYPTPSQIAWAELKRLNIEERRNIYFGACPRRMRRGSKDSISYICAFWVDLDAKDFGRDKDKALAQLLERLPLYLYPSVIVDTGGGYHLYWLFKEPETVESTEEIGRYEGYLNGLAKHLGGDLNACDLARILRIPGFVNMKYPDLPPMGQE